MSTYAKYLEKFVQRHENDFNKNKENRIATDPYSYINFLELQMEKSAQAVLITDALAQKIDFLQNQINSINDKLSKNADIIKLFETCKEAQVSFCH